MAVTRRVVTTEHHHEVAEATCDRCGEAVQNDVESIRLEGYSKSDGKPRDICDSCLRPVLMDAAERMTDDSTGVDAVLNRIDTHPKSASCVAKPAPLEPVTVNRSTGHTVNSARREHGIDPVSSQAGGAKPDASNWYGRMPTYASFPISFEWEPGALAKLLSLLAEANLTEARDRIVQEAARRAADARRTQYHAV